MPLYAYLLFSTGSYYIKIICTVIAGPHFLWLPTLDEISLDYLFGLLAPVLQSVVLNAEIMFQLFALRYCILSS